MEVFTTEFCGNGQKPRCGIVIADRKELRIFFPSFIVNRLPEGKHYYAWGTDYFNGTGCPMRAAEDRSRHGFHLIKFLAMFLGVVRWDIYWKRSPNHTKDLPQMKT